MDASVLIAYITGGSGLLTALGMFVHNVRKPDKQIEYLNAALEDAINLKAQVQVLFASSTQAFNEGLEMRAKISDLQEELASAKERIAILEAEGNKEVSVLKAENHRLRTKVIELEYSLSHSKGNPDAG